MLVPLFQIGFALPLVFVAYKSENILFLHSGVAPALHAYESEVLI